MVIGFWAGVHHLDEHQLKVYRFRLKFNQKPRFGGGQRGREIESVERRM